MPAFVKSVTLKHSKRIAACKVDPGELTVPVGPNGAGKSYLVERFAAAPAGIRRILRFAST